LNQPLDEASIFCNSIFKQSGADELQNYLSELQASGDQDVLLWWKVHSSKYPNLSKMARDFLMISATSVPCERIFSTGANIISDRRNRLTPDHVRECICLEDWQRFLNNKNE